MLHNLFRLSGLLLRLAYNIIQCGCKFSRFAQNYLVSTPQMQMRYVTFAHPQTTVYMQKYDKCLNSFWFIEFVHTVFLGCLPFALNILKV